MSTSNQHSNRKYTEDDKEIYKISCSYILIINKNYIGLVSIPPYFKLEF